MTALPPKLHHLAIKTTQLETMAHWYQLVTGVHVIFQNEIASLLTNDGANLAFLARGV